ncbi:cobalamin-binding protein [Bacillus daqingensis]|uniref:Cobalamin-binding protein n=1 Tax=Bacillus daqingensis TaxID=872396 RepID=A0ABV9NUZ0_9BACI
MRIVSICPSNTELLHYCGLSTYLCGVDDYSDWPSSITGLERLGPDLSIDLDKVEALNPDLVYASLSVPGMEKNIEGLKDRGIPYMTVTNPESMSQVGEVLLEICEAAGLHQRGADLKHQYESFLNHYQSLADTITSRKPSLYWEWWPKPVFSPGGRNWLTEMSALAGGINMFHHDERASVKTDWEDIREHDPDVILAAWVGVEPAKVNPSVIKKRPGWTDMQALKTNQLHVMEEPFFCRPSPRLMIGLAKLAYLLHPDVYPEPTGREDEKLLQEI